MTIGIVLWQNRNGFEYDLDGTYSCNNFPEKLTFNSETRKVVKEYEGYPAVERNIF